jgi:coenzyme F420-reducing hydrogenase alpha subunit
LIPKKNSVVLTLRNKVAENPGTPEAYSNWSLSELVAEYDQARAQMSEVDDAIVSIKDQIGAAKARVFTHREYSDPDWFHRATAKLTHLGRRRQHIQEVVSNLKRLVKAAKQVERRAENDVRQASDDRIFVEVAKEILPLHVRLELWAAVERRKSAGLIPAS